MNKDLYLNEIHCEIELEDGVKCKEIAANMRYVYFNGHDKLKIPGRDFINNYSVFPKNVGIDGYLFFFFDGVHQKRIENTKFEFITYDEKKYILNFQESKINPKTLFYDDTIWEKI